MANLTLRRAPNSDIDLNIVTPKLSTLRAERTVAMRARQLIDGASFGPDTLKVIGKAFDAAWAEIASNFGEDPIDIANARLRLANELLSVAYEDSREVEVLKRAALQRMAVGCIQSC